MTLTRMQQFMVEDGFPAELILTDAERREQWKGVKLSKQGSGFRKLDAAEQRQRNRLQREYDRFREEQKRARLAALRERD